jgi:DNA-binding protein HU-beta
MARDDRFKKVQEAGADFLETARARAEEFLKELSRAGGGTQGRAQGAFDDLLEGSRRGTEQLVASIRKEITSQLSALGLATQSDLQALERRLSGRTTSTARAGAAKTGATKSSAAKKTAAKTTAAKKTTTRKTAAAKKTTTARRTAAKKTAG